MVTMSTAASAPRPYKPPPAKTPITPRVLTKSYDVAGSKKDSWMSSRHSHGCEGVHAVVPGDGVRIQFEVDRWGVQLEPGRGECAMNSYSDRQEAGSWL